MESPFASRLGTTFVPSDNEAVEIKKILDKYTPKLAQISSELARVRALYEELENQHKQLADEMDAHRRLLSPLRRDLLPTDILQEIFLSCLPISHDSIMTKKEAPVLLTQVCSSWRRIALNTPLLWASIHIPITFTPLAEEVGNASFSDAATDLRMTKRVSAVREWLSRSKDCPLSFTFGSGPNIFWANRHCGDVISLLQSHLGRWHRVKVNATKYYITMFAALDGRQMPLLESIMVCNASMRGWGGPSPIVTENRPTQLSLFESPSLRSLNVSYLNEDITSLPVRWAALCHLCLHHNEGPTEIPQIFDLLKACTRLVSFRLTTAYSPPTTTPSLTQPRFHPTADTVVSLPFLETFSFVHHIDVVYPNSFDSVEFPALREIDYHWPHRPSLQPPLLSLLRKQGHSITTLTTNTELFSEENFRSCLRCCPHLKKLSIHAFRSPELIGEEPAPTMDISLLESLSSLSSSGEYLCPELEVLESSVIAVCSDQDVLDFLARKQAGILPGMSKLKSLRLLFGREQKQPLAELVRPYIEEGLDLGLVYRFPINRASSMYDHLPFNFNRDPTRESGPALF